MSDPWSEIEDYARGKREAAAAEQRAAETDARFDEINAKIDTLADGVSKLAESSARRESPAEESDEGAAASSGGNGSAAPEKSKPQAPPSEPELPVELVERMDVPRIYTGDDEPAEVQYIDGPTGETRTRPGRRKGHPTTWNVMPYEEPSGEIAEAN